MEYCGTILEIGGGFVFACTRMKDHEGEHIHFGHHHTEPEAENGGPIHYFVVKWRENPTIAPEDWDEI